MSTDCEDFRICSSMAGRNLPQSFGHDSETYEAFWTAWAGAPATACRCPAPSTVVSRRRDRRARPIGVTQRVLENNCLVGAAVVSISGGANLTATSQFMLLDWVYG